MQLGMELILRVYRRVEPELDCAQEKISKLGEEADNRRQHGLQRDSIHPDSV